jgi:hypothetical protein
VASPTAAVPGRRNEIGTRSSSRISLECSHAIDGPTRPGKRRPPKSKTAEVPIHGRAGRPVCDEEKSTAKFRFLVPSNNQKNTEVGKELAMARASRVRLCRSRDDIVRSKTAKEQSERVQWGSPNTPSLKMIGASRRIPSEPGRGL